jgi:hypothetical protein
MSDEILPALREFIESFETVFGNDWPYTKSMLGIYDETPAQKAAAQQAGLETIPIISEAGTFLAPDVDDEGEDWGHRGLLLERYRRLKRLLAQLDRTA